MEDNVTLTEEESAEPGPYQFERTPFCRAIVDSVQSYREVVILKAQRVGISKAIQVADAYALANDPGNLAYVWPERANAEKAMEIEIGPMVSNTPALQRKLGTRKANLARRRIRLYDCQIDLVWSSNITTLTGRTFRRMRFDEIEDMSDTGPIDIVEFAKLRTRTYGDRASIAIFGHPRSRHGRMWRLWETVLVRFAWHVPCPVCGRYQVMQWSQVRWPDDMTEQHGYRLAASIIENRDLAWYECIHCSARLTEEHKRDMNLRGVWAGPEEEITQADIDEEYELQKSLAAEIDDPPPYRYGALQWNGLDRATRQIGYHVTALYSPWVTFSELASIYLSAIGRPRAMSNFYSSFLGWIYEPDSKRITSHVFKEKVEGAPAPGTIPPWTTYLVAAADTQKDSFWYVVRAFGPAYKSQLVAYGQVQTFEELRTVGLTAAYPCSDNRLPGMSPSVLVIDAGGGEVFRPREEQGEDVELAEKQRLGGVLRNRVYEFSLSDSRIVPVRGHGGQKRMPESWRLSRLKFQWRDDVVDIEYLRLNTDEWKDQLDAHIRQPVEAENYWGLHRGVEIDYILQMTSEHCIQVDAEWRWVPKTMPAKNHLWDCEYYALAYAYFRKVAYHLTLEKTVEAMTAEGRRRRGLKRDYHGLTTPDGRPFLVTDR